MQSVQSCAGVHGVRPQDVPKLPGKSGGRKMPGTCFPFPRIVGAELFVEVLVYRKCSNRAPIPGLIEELDPPYIRNQPIGINVPIEVVVDL